MTEQAPENALERIDRALARIEAAAIASTTARSELQDRHDRLRTRIGSAIASLDSLIAQGDDG